VTDTSALSLCYNTTVTDISSTSEEFPPSWWTCPRRWTKSQSAGM